MIAGLICRKLISLSIFKWVISKLDYFTLFWSSESLLQFVSFPSNQIVKRKIEKCIFSFENTEKFFSNFVMMCSARKYMLSRASQKLMWVKIGNGVRPYFNLKYSSLLHRNNCSQNYWNPAQKSNCTFKLCETLWIMNYISRFLAVYNQQAFF